MKTIYIECHCGDARHLVRFKLLEAGGEVYMDTVMVPDAPFLKHLWYTFLYLLRRPSPYGVIGETIITPADQKRLYDWLGR